VKLSEQALKYVASQYVQRIDERVRNDVQKAVKKRDRRGAGIEKLTMGQLVQVLLESKFLDAWEQVSGKDLSSFRTIDLEKLTQLRNKIIHESKEATRIDAEFLLHNLKLILDSFDIVSFEESEEARAERTSDRESSESSKPSSTQSIHIEGNASGNIFIEGDQSTASIQFQQVSLPQPESVNIQEELAAIRQILKQLQSPDQKKIENAMSDAEEELKKPKPDKEEVGQALDRALKYAKRTEEFAGVMGKLKPHIVSAATWLGSNWHKILSIVGLAT
jgi:hypothetical protein